jgi:hypothetical protein
MAKFFNTSATHYFLEEIIKAAKARLNATTTLRLTPAPLHS